MVVRLSKLCHNVVIGADFFGAMCVNAPRENNSVGASSHQEKFRPNIPNLDLSSKLTTWEVQPQHSARCPAIQDGYGYIFQLQKDFVVTPQTLCECCRDLSPVSTTRVDGPS